jgi:hypothetical protein
MFRRNNRNGLLVNVNGENIRTWYYGPVQFSRFFSKHFSLIALKPVGFMVPPSYLENYFRTKPQILSFLAKIEKVFFERIGFLGGFSDHCLIDLRIKL